MTLDAETQKIHDERADPVVLVRRAGNRVLVVPLKKDFKGRFDDEKVFYIATPRYIAEELDPHSIDRALLFAKSEAYEQLQGADYVGIASLVDEKTLRDAKYYHPVSVIPYQRLLNLVKEHGEKVGLLRSPIECLRMTEDEVAQRLQKDRERELDTADSGVLKATESPFKGYWETKETL